MFRQQYLVRVIDFHSGFWRLGQAFLLAALFLLLLAIAPSAQAQGRCVIYDSGWYFWMSGGYIKGNLDLYNNNSCTPPSEGGVSTGKYGMVDAGSREAAISSCIRHTGFSNMAVGPAGALFWSCKPIFDSTDGSGSSSGGNTPGSATYRKPEIQASKLPLGSVMANAELGLNSGIVFQRFDHYAVGVQSVVDMGVLDVVDVWGQATQNFEVCFPQAGKVVFLDAATSPRTVVDVTNFKRDGYSCAAMDRAGTMVLVESSSASSTVNQAIAQSFIDSTNDPVDSAINLDHCEVTPSHKLNLRDEPWGQVLTVMRKGATVTATARTQSWFKVIFTELESDNGDNDDDQAEPIEGWIAAWLSETEGDCSWDVDDHEGPALASTRFLAQDESFSIT